MGLGLLTDEEFEVEIGKINNQIKHVDSILGRNGKKAVPAIIRESAAADLIAGATSKEVQEAYGISASSAEAYKNGAHSTTTYHEPNESLQRANDAVRNQIIGGARAKLLQALEGITPDKLAGSKAKDLASIAKDMSSVINQTEPTQSNPTGNVQFIFHVPPIKEEKDFGVIDVTN